jgi:CelD/BcsL family acetyltransferase involved in cellulose biosynthesis
MPVTTAVLDPCSDARWLRLADRAPQATIFHHPLWLGLVGRHYRYPLAAAAVLDAAGEAVAGLPLALVASRLTGRRLVALPFSDACPPLVATDAPNDAAQRLAGAVEDLRRRHAMPVEVRGAFPELALPVDRFHEHRVDLTPGLDEVERAYTSQVRRNVRKARREGVEVRRRVDAGALEEFYVLHLQTRRRLGVPTQPKAFVLGLGDLLQRGHGFVSIARLAGRPVAAALFLHAGGTLTYKYGASDPEFQQARPNNLLFADAIAWACEQQLRELDLGRTDFGHDGLRAFKLSWGAAETPLAHTYAGGPPPGPGPSLAERVLAPLIRRGPVLTGRVIGEVLYRHAG